MEYFSSSAADQLAFQPLYTFSDEQEVQHMAPTSSTEDTLRLEKIYTELQAGIRETDNISFRLLGLVPLVSGAALIGVILKDGTHGPVVMLLSLFAAGVTLGIFRWELRNSQKCNWLIRYADCLEQHALNAHGVGAIHHTLPTAPQNIGKQKERW